MTKVPIDSPIQNISYKESFIFIGSCFAEEIGQRMKELEFNVDINPNGVMFNPISVASTISLLDGSLSLNSDDLLENSKVWYSFMHSGKFAAKSKEELSEVLISNLNKSSEKFAKSKNILLTFGTSYVYKLIENNKIVSNCHKVNSSLFNREFLEADIIVSVFKDLIKKHSDKRWIFTLSPVRHLRDGAHENQLSKANLLIAIDKIVSSFNNAFYFPAYEIMLDELRDYRFYATDMLHPSELAVNIIWERFLHSFFSPETVELAQLAEKLRIMKKHKILTTYSSEFEIYLNNLKNLEKRFNEKLLKIK